MSLDKLQKALISGLKIMGVRLEVVAAILELLETEEQRLQMKDWIAAHIKDSAMREIDAMEAAERIAEVDYLK